jgi:hypothetical protein
MRTPPTRRLHLHRLASAWRSARALPVSTVDRIALGYTALFLAPPGPLPLPLVLGLRILGARTVPVSSPAHNRLRLLNLGAGLLGARASVRIAFVLALAAGVPLLTW